MLLHVYLALLTHNEAEGDEFHGKLWQTVSHESIMSSLKSSNLRVVILHWWNLQILSTSKNWKCQTDGLLRYEWCHTGWFSTNVIYNKQEHSAGFWRTVWSLVLGKYKGNCCPTPSARSISTTVSASTLCLCRPLWQGSQQSKNCP